MDCPISAREGKGGETAVKELAALLGCGEGKDTCGDIVSRLKNCGMSKGEVGVVPEVETLRLFQGYRLCNVCHLCYY